MQIGFAVYFIINDVFNNVCTLSDLHKNGNVHRMNGTIASGETSVFRTFPRDGILSFRSLLS